MAEPLTTLLVVAHPGHELRVWGWLCAVKPTVCVLTDGSGSNGQPRLAMTTRVLREAGTTLAPLYGATSDRAVYAALLEQRHDYFIELAHTLCELLCEGRFAAVVGDAVEGYNPSHDLCGC